MTIEDLKKEGLILFDGLNGSHLFGTNREDSDEDYKGVFILPKRDLYLGNMIQQVDDEKGDQVYYELSRFVELLKMGKPNAIEILFSTYKCVRSKHPLFNELTNIKEMFLGVDYLKSTVGFAQSQIRKAQGTNKKINWSNEEKQRKGVLDFCFISYGQGSIQVSKWLNINGLKQEYCGLVAIPNMRYTYGVYYDIWQHIQFEKLSREESYEFLKRFTFPTNMCNADISTEYTHRVEYFKNSKYKGIVQDKVKSNEVSLSAVEKNEVPITTMMFNLDGYSSHCRVYREYLEYLDKRNVTRYTDVKEHKQQYDGKNLLHMMRTLNMGVEYLDTGVFNIDRTDIDRDYLLSIRKGDVDLEDIISIGESKIEYINKNMKNAPKYNYNVNDVVYGIRDKFYMG